MGYKTQFITIPFLLASLIAAPVFADNTSKIEEVIHNRDLNNLQCSGAPQQTANGL